MRVVIDELKLVINVKTPRYGQAKIYQTRYRDLMIGIVLNVTCNIESSHVTEYLIEQDVLMILSKILIDSRHDWPTNGAALALL